MVVRVRKAVKHFSRELEPAQRPRKNNRITNFACKPGPPRTFSFAQLFLLAIMGIRISIYTSQKRRREFMKTAVYAQINDSLIVAQRRIRGSRLGFTLIELLVVIAIIAILAAML